ncbi:MAG TPA: hypothetical protein VH877_29155 [Polyangia bacterium]|jgi:hypothetical protein|nr:hypothetical protein [Polyangia bacterium]
MGDVIRRTAAAEDIFADVRSTHANALAKGGLWHSIAEARLGPVVKLIDRVEERYQAALKALAPLTAALDDMDDRADELLSRISDDIWNDVGRPAHDPALALLFPGGIGYYTEGPDDEQPDRMELLAELLEANLHPKLELARVRRYAAEIRDAAQEYAGLVELHGTARRRVELLGRIRVAVARSAHVELAGVKRCYKAEGFGEAEIHTVIPDHGIAAKVG